MSNQAEIDQLINQLRSELIDEQTRKKYGTSIEQHMQHDYDKKIRKKFEDLQGVFQEIDISGDQQLSLTEFTQFFQRKKPDVSQSEINGLFKLCDRDGNQNISINEFVYMYLLLEEKLKLKKDTLNDVRNNLNSQIVTYEDKKKYYQDEQINEYGICDDNEVKIRVIEGYNLKNHDRYATNKVILTMKNKYDKEESRQETREQKNCDNPQYNESFSFRVKEHGNKIICDVVNPDNLINPKYGKFIIDLVDFMDQFKHEYWYDLDDNENNGRIHISGTYVYNHPKHYTDLINKTTQQINKLTSTCDTIEDLLQCIDEPYGLIYYGKINDIINQKILEKSSDPNEYLGSTRTSVYGPDVRINKGGNLRGFSPAAKEEEITGGRLGVIQEEGGQTQLLVNDMSTPMEGEVNQQGWKKYLPKNKEIMGGDIPNYLILGGVALSILSLLGKFDIFNLLLFGFGCCMIYDLFKINNRVPSKKIFFYGLLACIVFDLIWMMTSAGEGKGLIYLFTIASVGIKGYLAYYMYKKNMHQ